MCARQPIDDDITYQPICSGCDDAIGESIDERRRKSDAPIVRYSKRYREAARHIGSKPAVCVGVRFLQDLNALGCGEALKRASLGEAPAGGVPTAQGARVRQRGHHSICFKPESAASFALAIAALTSPPVSCRNLRRLVEACRGLAARSSSSLS